MIRSFPLMAAVVLGVVPAAAQTPTPLRQSALTRETAGARLPFTLEDASHDDRWIGLEPRDVRWAVDGSGVYFRWNQKPTVGQDPDADPWFFTGRDGKAAREAKPDEPIPDRYPSSSRDRRVTAWTSQGSLYVYLADEAGGAVRAVASLGQSLGPALVAGDGSSVQFTAGEDLLSYDIRAGRLRQVTRKHARDPAAAGEARRWLAGQQRDLFGRVRDDLDRRTAAAARARLVTGWAQAIPVVPGVVLESLQLSPNGRFVTFVARTPASPRATTSYLDYVAASGYAEPKLSRGKVGEPQDRLRMGIVRVDPAVDPDSVQITWVDLPEAGGRETVPHGLVWSVENDRAVVQLASADWHDLWIADLDPGTGRTRVLAHDHDDAWLGGPPVLSNEGGPTFLEWLPGGRIAFASERSGWSHLYLIEPGGEVRPLTSGPWEVRSAELSRDRTTWLLGTSKTSPADDHLYLLPAAGGDLIQLTESPGRHIGALAPDGRRFADLYGNATELPDLFLRDAAAGTPPARVTASGTDAFFRHRFVRPAIVSVTHPDGKPVWAAIYSPAKPNKEHAAVVHVHGGGYRQFTHHGWSVYGYALHVGTIHYLLEQGYTVMDFDYRGGAGYGRDYRTDIYRSMGQKDVDGVIPAIDYLVRERGVDRRRIGVVGVSYGGFFTLMALFRHPGLFAAGIANAAVTDWAHYSHEWTSRVLGVPAKDPEAYKVSSPIYYTKGLADPLLITHGLVDDNVEFQDAARLVQKLIEDGKPFEVMYYPTEPHTIQTEASRLDYMKRAAAFFDRHLRGK
ncbi:MAG: prolyl oligopeptidase family serine peptidase [Gemmatimonadota bacterium]